MLLAVATTVLWSFGSVPTLRAADGDSATADADGTTADAHSTTAEATTAAAAAGEGVVGNEGRAQQRDGSQT